MKSFTKLLKSAVGEDKKHEDGPMISRNYKDLPSFKVTYPNNDIQLRHIAPYDKELKALIYSYFPSNLKVQKDIARPGSKIQRPRTLSLQPNLSDVEWNTCANETDVAYAMSITLYEEEPSVPGVPRNAGDPIADCCAVVTTKNNVIMVCADGCGWGQNARTAARIAVLRMLKSLTDNVYSDVYTSEDLFECLNSGLNAVQKDLVNSGGSGLTTLCATVIAPFKDFHERKTEKEWVVCNLRVGDTSTYLYSSESKEITLISHRFQKQSRDMKDCGGCLGPVLGSDPDLENLAFSVILAKSSSTVFLATDGVGDNFNPYVTNQLVASKCTYGKACKNELVHRIYCSCNAVTDDSLGSGSSCDLDDYFEHKELTIAKQDVELHNEFCGCDKISVEGGELCSTLVDILSLKYLQQTIDSYYIQGTVLEFVSSICRMLVNATESKRKAMSRYKFRIKDLSASDFSEVSRIHRTYVKTLPGKLDHASIVAANLGMLKSLDCHSICSTDGFTKNIHYPIERMISRSPNTMSKRSDGPSIEFEDISL